MRRSRSLAAVVLGLVVSLVGLSTAAWAAWTDSAGVSGPVLSTVTPQAPVAACEPLTVGQVVITWGAVEAATGYRVHYGSGGATTLDVPASTTSHSFTGIASGTFFVQAIYGTPTWISANSNSLSYTSALFALGACG